MILRTSLNNLFKKQFNAVTRRNIVSKVRRPDGLLRPLQQGDNPLKFERSIQRGDLPWITIWVFCTIESLYLIQRIFKRITSPHHYIRMKNPSFVVRKD